MSPAFAKDLPALSPSQLTHIFWHWSQMHSIEEAAFDTDVHEDTIATVYDWLRDSVTTYMQQVNANTKIGGPGRIVCLDETHITKKKRNKGGFPGRETLGHDTIIMGGVELNGVWTGRKQTGRAFLVIIHNKKAETFREVIEKYVAEGTTIWTDGHSSYSWFDNDDRYKHDDKTDDADAYLLCQT